MKRYNQMSVFCKKNSLGIQPFLAATSRRREGCIRRLTVKRVRLALTSVVFVVVVIDHLFKPI